MHLGGGPSYKIDENRRLQHSLESSGEDDEPTPRELISPIAA